MGPLGTILIAYMYQVVMFLLFVVVVLIVVLCVVQYVCHVLWHLTGSYNPAVVVLDAVCCIRNVDYIFRVHAMYCGYETN